MCKSANPEKNNLKTSNKIICLYFDSNSLCHYKTLQNLILDNWEIVEVKTQLNSSNREIYLQKR